MGRRRLAFDETFAKSTCATEPLLEPPHLTVIPLVIIAKKVKQAVQGKHPNLGRQAVPGLSRLPARNSKRNHDIAELPRLIRWKRQDIRRHVLSPIAAIERADTPIGNNGNGHGTSGARRRHRLEPAHQPCPYSRRRDDGDGRIVRARSGLAGV